MLDPDRRLALSYVASPARKRLTALWSLDTAFGNALAGGREPMIARIKPVWWREALEKLDSEAAPPEPVLQAVAAHILPAVSGAELAEMEQAWAALLGAERLTRPDLDTHAARGANLFRLSARLLGGDTSAVIERAGEGWALIDLARNSNRPDAEAALAAARHRLRNRERWSKPLRTLGMLALLARRDAERGLDKMEPPGAPPRLARMLRHRLTGR